MRFPGQVRGRSALSTYVRSERDTVMLPYTHRADGVYPIGKHLSSPVLLAQLLQWVDEDDVSDARL